MVFPERRHCVKIIGFISSTLSGDNTFKWSRLTSIFFSDLHPKTSLLSMFFEVGVCFSMFFFTGPINLITTPTGTPHEGDVNVAILTCHGGDHSWWAPNHQLRITWMSMVLSKLLITNPYISTLFTSPINRW